MERYAIFKQRQNDEFNKFPIGCAFSNQQLEDMMKKFNLPNDKTGYRQLVNIGPGVFIKKSDVDAFLALDQKLKAEREAYIKSDEGFLAALEYEFGNHECQISWRWEEALAAVGLKESELDEHRMKLYVKAQGDWMAKCRKNDWF